MRIHSWILVGLLSLSAASAMPVSLTGVISRDDQVVLIRFRPASDGILIRTLSYAGGINVEGNSIAPGGFDPILSVYSPGGLLLALNAADPMAPVDVSTGFAFDAELTVTGLTKDWYTLALTQWDNFPNGPFLSDGFLRSGQPSFSGDATGQPGARFVDVGGNRRSGSWAVDLIEVHDVSLVPEPAAGGMMVLGLALLGACARRRPFQPGRRTRRRPVASAG